MILSTKPFNSILDLIKAFPTQEVCIKHLESIRWSDSVISPFDANSKVYPCAGNKYKCRNTNKYFNVLTGTIFENTKIPLQTWFLAIYLIATHKKGISSYQLGSDLTITQKTSWFLLGRIRYAMAHESFMMELNGTVEVDESYVGGKNKNRHKDKKKEGAGGRSPVDKEPVFGMLQNEVSQIIERPDKRNIDRIVKEKIVIHPAVVRPVHVPNVQTDTIIPIIQEHVKEGTTVVSDEYIIYRNLRQDYDHQVVYHRLNNYVTEDGFTTNRMEGYWNILKKATTGTYYGRITPKHLHRYCSESAYRFNTRHMDTNMKFDLLLQGSNKRLRYLDLIKK